VLDEYRTPAFAPTLGLLLYGANYVEPGGRLPDGGFVSEITDAIGDILGGLWKRIRERGESPERPTRRGGAPRDDDPE
jgi:hypothetical protein